jgi:hypothetical protein
MGAWSLRYLKFTKKSIWSLLQGCIKISEKLTFSYKSKPRMGSTLQGTSRLCIDSNLTLSLSLTNYLHHIVRLCFNSYLALSLLQINNLHHIKWWVAQSNSWEMQLLVTEQFLCLSIYGFRSSLPSFRLSCCIKMILCGWWTRKIVWIDP